MSITVDVGLLSGRTVSVRAGLDEVVGTLRHWAQTALGIGKGRLLDSSGKTLDLRSPIKLAGVQDGDFLTLHVSKVEIQSSFGAFAAILGDASVVAVLTTVATVVLRRISCRTCDRFKPPIVLLLLLLVMDRS